MWQGKFVTAKRRGRWEYAGRARGIHAAAAIVALDGEEVILVSQYRVPLGQAMRSRLPAGLVWRYARRLGRTRRLRMQLARELEEETGYRAGRMEVLCQFYSSPGMLSESFTLLRAHDLKKSGRWRRARRAKDITVHRVPLDRPARRIVEDWRQTRADAVDVKIGFPC